MFDASEWRSFSIEQFFKMDDDMKKYVFVHHTIIQNSYFRRVDNDEKTGIYLITPTININNQDKFYIKTTLAAWIVYNKTTKKVSVGNPQHLKDEFIRDYFNYPSLVNRLIKNLTPSFCKMVVEKKINTVRDLMKYNKRNFFSGIKINVERVPFYMLNDLIHVSKVLSNPNLPYTKEDLKEIPYELIRSRAFKIDKLEGIKERYDEWKSKQSFILSSVSRSGDEEVRRGVYPISI